MIETPELDKIRAVHDESQKLGYFLEWLTHGLTLCQWHDGEVMDIGGGMREYLPEGYYPVHINIEAILASYYEIDLQKAEDEKRALLEEFKKNKEG